MLTGLVHLETGRQFAFCTADGDEGFLLGAEDMASPDVGKDLAAPCGTCKTKADEAALSEGRVAADLDGGDQCPRRVRVFFKGGNRQSRLL